jgi:hypothetical protein
MGGEGIVLKERSSIDLSYKHPRSGADVQIQQTVRFTRSQPFELKLGRRAEVVCWGVMPSGLLRHPLFLRNASAIPSARLRVETW